MIIDQIPSQRRPRLEYPDSSFELDLKTSHDFIGVFFSSCGIESKNEKIS